MPNVLNVARYIIKNYHQNNLSAMKLERLVYYSQAWSLALLHQPLFPNDIQAWINGPVCPHLFKSHRHQSNLDKNFLNNTGYNQDVFTHNQKMIMNDVIKYYGKHSTWYLNELARKELPWQLTRNGIPFDRPCRKVISKKSMMDYYSKMIVS